MGYAFIMFGVLLIMSVVIVTAFTYGIAKDSEIAPLKAENIYAERETGKVQTGITIVLTCLSVRDRYTYASGGSISGPHTLNLLVKNNESTVLNPNIATVLYNTSYINFTVIRWEKDWEPEWEGDQWDNDLDGNCREGDKENFTVWTPLSYVCMQVPNILIPTPDSPAPGPELRLLVAAENGVSTIAPTSPTNFTGKKSESNFTLSWNASYDEDGIAYYRLYGLTGDFGDCHHYNTFQEIPGNITTTTLSLSRATWFYVTAVDTLQNEGVQSRTIKCEPGQIYCGY